MAGKRRFRRFLFWAILLVAAVALFRQLDGKRLQARISGGAVAVVFVEGTIVDAGAVVRRLDSVAEDDSIAAVVLRVDSPGGGVASSQEIYDAVWRVRAEKPIVASLGGMAASGGYYVASACNEIVSNPGTLTGSIGVIMAFANYEELLKKIGLSGTVIKAGRYKDVGSPLREMTPEERELLDDMLDDVHEQFVEAVARGRGVEPDAVRPMSDGRLLTGAQALDHGLVDSMGGLHEAVSLAARRAGVEGDPIRIDFRDAGDWTGWLRGAAGSLGELTRVPFTGLGFLYTGPFNAP